MTLLRNIAQDPDVCSSYYPDALRVIAPTTCFSCTRSNATTFRIVEDDRWHEQPFIYVKMTPHALVIVDTGCGGSARDPSAELTSLRTYLETYPIPDYGDEPLNEDAEKDYIVICTHCHYDHIGAIEQFTDENSAIWASSYDRSFLTRENLPTSSLCRFVGMQTPQYKVTYWADDGLTVSHKGMDLGLTIYQTPGHTPDELAMWDAVERTLHVGDSLYEWAPIIFPKEGDLRTYSRSMGKLRQLVKCWNAPSLSDSTSGPASVKKVAIACGHVTSEADAGTILQEVDAFLWDVVSGRVTVVKEGINRDELVQLFERQDGKFSFRAPKRLFEDFKADDAAMSTLRKRVADGV